MSDQIQMDRIDVGGIRIAYRRAGMGPPLVLLHGGPSDSREWHYQLQGLSDEFAVVAWDMPGCGQSADPPEHFLHTRDYADCLAAFIEALDRKSTRLNSSHTVISYAVFCLKKKTKIWYANL